MEYLIAMLALGALCGCALGAYVLFEGIERDQEEDRARSVERARRPAGAVLEPPVRLSYPRSDGRGWAPRDRLDGRIGAAGGGETSRSAANREPVGPAMSPERREEHRPPGWGGVAAHADRLDRQVRRLEETLDLLMQASSTVVSTPSG